MGIVARFGTGAKIPVVAMRIDKTQNACFAFLVTLRQQGVRTRRATRPATQLKIARFQPITEQPVVAVGVGIAITGMLGTLGSLASRHTALFRTTERIEQFAGSIRHATRFRLRAHAARTLRAATGIHAAKRIQSLAYAVRQAASFGFGAQIFGA